VLEWNLKIDARQARGLCSHAHFLSHSLRDHRVSLDVTIIDQGIESRIWPQLARNGDTATLSCVIMAPA
jgi:hypothetical protein